MKTYRLIEDRGNGNYKVHYSSHSLRAVRLRQGYYEKLYHQKLKIIVMA